MSYETKVTFPQTKKLIQTFEFCSNCVSILYGNCRIYKNKRKEEKTRKFCLQKAVLPRLSY